MVVTPLQQQQQPQIEIIQINQQQQQQQQPMVQQPPPQQYQQPMFQQVDVGSGGHPVALPGQFIPQQPPPQQYQPQQQLYQSNQPPSYGQIAAPSVPYSQPPPEW